jgi:hypothetical protein
MRHVPKKYSSFQLQPRLASKADRGLSLAFRLIQVDILATEEYALEQVDVVLKCSLSAVQLIAMGIGRHWPSQSGKKTNTDGASQKFCELGETNLFFLILPPSVTFEDAECAKQHQFTKAIHAQRFPVLNTIAEILEGIFSLFFRNRRVRLL